MNGDIITIMWIYNYLMEKYLKLKNLEFYVEPLMNKGMEMGKYMKDSWIKIIILNLI